MNFKHIAIAASLIAGTSTTFAADIDLAGLAAVTATVATADLQALSEANLLVGEAVANNEALIIQDDVDAASGIEQIALIDQIANTGGHAAIYQMGSTTGIVNVAYIQQNATTNNKAVIVQR
jgi:hypothetical protein